VRESTPGPVRGSTALDSNGYRISVDDGRESFFALSIEDPDHEARWLMSDTVRSLREMR